MRLILLQMQRSYFVIKLDSVVERNLAFRFIFFRLRFRSPSTPSFSLYRWTFRAYTFDGWDDWETILRKHSGTADKMYGEEHKDKFAFFRTFIINKFFESIHRGILQRRSLPPRPLPLPPTLLRMSEHHFSKKKKKERKKKAMLDVRPIASVSMSQAFLLSNESLQT